MSTLKTNKECGYEKLLSLSGTSKEQFLKEYLQLDAKTAEDLYLSTLLQIKKSVIDGNVEELKRLGTLVGYINSVQNDETLRTCYNSDVNPLFVTNLVILSCKGNKYGILKCLFSADNNIINSLSIDIGNGNIKPDEQDEECHNAFYYAIRSGNVNLLETLISDWPGDYFVHHEEELDAILSKSYEELKLKDVQLCDEIEVFVENKLTNLRFFCTNYENTKISKNNVENRIMFVLDIVNNLKVEYLNMKISGRFLFILKFITQNIHILKQQLKSTYSRLPWEEIEFCLVCYISSELKHQEINLFYRSVLNADKILFHLENFTKKLAIEMRNLKNVDTKTYSEIPNINRDNVITDIINNSPQFIELYDDYKQIRDIYSLIKIRNYLKLAISVDSKKKEGQTVIMRALQVTGENLKNTLESPKLSTKTSDHLIVLAPKNLSVFLRNLRNSLSHSKSLYNRMEVEDNEKETFFTDIQNDIKNIYSSICNLVHRKTVEFIRKFLKTIIDCENLDEILPNYSAALGDFTADLSNYCSPTFISAQLDEIEILTKKIDKHLVIKTTYETECFNKIYNIITCQKNKCKNYQDKHVRGLAMLDEYNKQFYSFHKFDDNVVRSIKHSANLHLQHSELCNFDKELHSLKEIPDLLAETFKSHEFNLNTDFSEIHEPFRQLCYIIESDLDQIKIIGGLRQKLNKKPSTSTSGFRQNEIDQLSDKITLLKKCLLDNSLSSDVIKHVCVSRKNKELQAVVEMLILDIMSLLTTSKHCLVNNYLVLDDNSPTLVGKYLRNHLAHGNALIDILPNDPAVLYLTNAWKLISENLIQGNKKIGKIIPDNIDSLKYEYERKLLAVANQDKLFRALEEGNMEDVIHYIKQGGDVHARSLNLWSTLHFAAKGPNVDVVKFILKQNLDVNTKDINGQNALHVAATFGRTNIVKYLVKEVKVFVDSIDKINRTALHISAQNGYENIVQILLKHKADQSIIDDRGYAPFHCAVHNNHLNVVKILLEKKTDVHRIEIVAGYTALHIAAENGYVDMVEFLIEKNAKVNARNDREEIPLHTTALNGHVDVVKILISKGSNVNAVNVGGCVPLHCALERGHEEIAKMLLCHGAFVNMADFIFKNTPLHYASKFGYIQIVKLLLQNNAHVNDLTYEGLTPLFLAAKEGHTDIVDLLRSNKASVNVRNYKGSTPLHACALSGHIDTVHYLLKAGIEVDSKTYDNVTALHFACQMGHRNVAQVLIESGANVHAVCDDSSRALHLCVLSNNSDIVELLIKSRADINVQTNNQQTVLHGAIIKNCKKEFIECLLQNGALVNIKDAHGMTPLHYAAACGNQVLVNLLLESKAKVNIQDKMGFTPFHKAVRGDHVKTAEILIEKGADVNYVMNLESMTPLCYAVKNNNEHLVRLLLHNDADVNAQNGKPLNMAVVYGFINVVLILLNHKKIDINIKNEDNVTVLHLAATRGYRDIAAALIEKGVNAATKTLSNFTPLYLAAQEGHADVVELLLTKNANVNDNNLGSTPLHIAAVQGHADVVEILIKNGAHANVIDYKNRTPTEHAISRGYFRIVKMLLEQKDVKINTVGNMGYSLLHIAAQEGKQEIIKYLIGRGADINVKNNLGSKPIHIAAREGHTDVVKLFLNEGISIDDLGAGRGTLLHYAALGGQLETTKYLIEQKFNIDAIDDNCFTPVHSAALSNHEDVIDLLLKNGCIYNSINILNKTPSEVVTKESIARKLLATEKLFKAVQQNLLPEIEKNIKDGAYINAKNRNNVSPLHYACWKGYKRVVDILLKYEANPDIAGKSGCTPLHYACKFSHLEIVKVLLAYGAKYNAKANESKTPLHLSQQSDIISLLQLIENAFKSVLNGNTNVIEHLKKIKNIELLKSVMNACSSDGKTLIVTAIHNDFPKIDTLKNVFEEKAFEQTNLAVAYCMQEKYKEALDIYKTILKSKSEIFGVNNPAFFDVQISIANILFKQMEYQKVLNLLTEIYNKQKNILGVKHQNTLDTKNFIALVLHTLGRNQEALEYFQEIYEDQLELLGKNHDDFLGTQLHMALVLDSLGRYEEALKLNYEVFEKRKEINGSNHPLTLVCQNNIGMVLAKSGQHEQALIVYQKVYELRKKILGAHHSDTLRTLHNMTSVLILQEKNEEAIRKFKDILNIQREYLGSNHVDTLNTQHNIANLLFKMGKLVQALKEYSEVLEKKKLILGSDHPEILHILQMLENINKYLKYGYVNSADILKLTKKSLHDAANDGEIESVQYLLDMGTDANIKDTDGRTPLHFAVHAGHRDVVAMLLQNGADATVTTARGNTSLHTATSKLHIEIIELLLQHVEKVNRKKMSSFINGQTTGGGSTALHVAVKAGCLEIVKLLLKHGAIYNAVDKTNKKIPVHYSENEEITTFLALIDTMFKGAALGELQIINEMKTMSIDDIKIIMNARDNKEQTLVQVAARNNHNNLANKLTRL